MQRACVFGCTCVWACVCVGTECQPGLGLKEGFPVVVSAPASLKEEVISCRHSEGARAGNEGL